MSPIDKRGSGGAGGEIFENECSKMVENERLAKLAYDLSMDAVAEFLAEPLEGKATPKAAPAVYSVA
jgi:hypothetical protein